jgi:hypothetical protein
MVGFDFDSLSGYWATKGPMLYVHMRLSNDPDLTIETILNEYYSAFGPASGLIRKYFDHWIAVTKKVKKQIGSRNADITAEIYTVDHFTESGKILEEAIKLAAISQDKKHLERVKFIQLGWLHGRMCVEFSHLYKDNKFNEARSKLNEIIKFRRKYEHTFFCDLAAASSAEKHGYKNLKALLEGKFRHHHEPALNPGKFQKKECHAFSNLKPSKWGLSLPEKMPPALLSTNITPEKITLLSKLIFRSAPAIPGLIISLISPLTVKIGRKSKKTSR